MTTPSVPTVPILGHVEGVELVETGTWNAMSGPVSFTPDDLASAVAALDCPAVRRPVLKAGHDEHFGVGEPALGYVANLRTANEGQTLIGDYRGMPAWLTQVDAEGQSVLASAYPDRSIEGEYGYRCQLGHEHPFVVHAVAILGIERPAVGTLQSLQELYGIAVATAPSLGGRQVAVLASARQETPVPQQITASATTDDVRRAYYSGPGSDWDLWIREMYVDPPELIVDNDADGSILRVPYTVAADGAVTFSDPQKVKVTYVSARAGADAPLVAFASRAESRPGERPVAAATPDPSTAPVAEPAAAGGTTTEEARVSDTLLTSLRQSLGLAEDADEATILAAHAEAMAERAEPAAPAAAPTALPDGTVAVDQQTWADTVAAATAGREARAQQLTERREQVVNAAVSEGRIPPARRDHWLGLLEADPGAETVLASLKPGAVPIEEIGHGTDTAAGTDDAWFPQFATSSQEG